MALRKTKRLTGQLVLVIMILMGISGMIFSGVRADGAAGQNLFEEQCQPGTGWAWTQGPEEPAVAAR